MRFNWHHLTAIIHWLRSNRGRCRLYAMLVIVFSTGLPSARALEIEGQPTQGALLFGQASPGDSVSIDGRPVRVSEEGMFLVGFGRDAPRQARIEVRSRTGEAETRDLVVQPRAYRVQRIDGLPKRKVEPNEADLARIRADAAAVREARGRDDPRTDFLSGFIWPVKGPITGVYGSQRILNGRPRRPHYGLDVAAPVGTPVRAPAGGVVTLAAPDLFFSGGTLIIDHGHGLSSSFLHLSKTLVGRGERVRQGQVIAEVGATGRVTGAHLDWRMNLFEARLDPALLVSPPEDNRGRTQDQSIGGGR